MAVEGFRLFKFLCLSLFLHLLLLFPFVLPESFHDPEPLRQKRPILVRIIDQPRPARIEAPETAWDASEFDSLARRPSPVEGRAGSSGSVGVPSLGQSGVARGEWPVAGGKEDTPRITSRRPPQGHGVLSSQAPSGRPGGARDGRFDLGEEGEAGSPKEQTISLESLALRYAPYLISVRRKIDGLWRYPAEARDRGLTGELLVLFTIARDGRLSSLELLRPSGFPILDQAALGAIRQAAPYAPFPERMDLDRLHITASFLYSRSPLKGKGGGGGS